MHRRNKTYRWLSSLIFLLGTWLAAQTTQNPAAPPATQNPAAPPVTSGAANANQQPASAGQSPAAANPSDQSGQAAPQGEAPSAEQNNVYIFKKEVDEVTLHATVVDARNQPINPQDKVFVVNFNEEYFLDQEYTGSVPKLQDALERIESRGGTALYDAVVASADHLKKSGELQKKVLLVVTDGEDNASRESLEQALRRLEERNGPTIYTIGLLGDEHSRRARRALREMAEDSGGVAFFPKDLNQVQEITTQIAHDIRNQYTIGYKPTTPQSVGGYRTVKVQAKAPGYKNLQVRTRSGYYAGQQQAEAGPGPQ
jgi:hypothetical protein